MGEILVIDIDRVATYLAQKEFTETLEDNLPYKELYEQVDESGDWYLKLFWQGVYDDMVDKWKEILEGFEGDALEEYLNI